MKKTFLLLVIFMSLIQSLNSQSVINITTSQNYGSSIQNAVDGVQNGETIQVGPGTYAPFEIDRAVSFTLESTDGAETTIIDGTGHNKTCVKFMQTSSANITFKGFTVTNGDADFDVSGGYGIYIGGGILCHYSSPTLENLIVHNNNADHSGGGIYFNQATYGPTIKRTLVYNNNAHSSFAGGVTAYNSNLVIEYSTFTKNSGYGLEVQSSSQIPLIYNTIISKNTVSNFYESTQGITYFENCYKQNSPNFKDYGANDFRLKYNSPCLDVFTVSSPEVLIEPEPNGGKANIGVYGNTLNSKITAVEIPYDFDNIQDGINQSTGDPVYVDEGIYIGRIIVGNKSLLIKARGNINNTIIYGGVLSNSYSYPSVIVNIEGFTVRQRTDDPFSMYTLSTIVDSSSNLNLTNMIIEDGIQQHHGGGIALYGPNGGTYSNIIVRYNYAEGYGSGIFFAGGEKTFNNIVVENNINDGSGNIIYLNNCEATFSNLDVINNNADIGSAMYIEDAHCIINNILIANNVSSGNNGGLYCKGPSNESVVINYLTIANNSGIGLDATTDYDLSVSNSIIWDEVDINNIPYYNLEYNNFKDDAFGGTNFTSDPLFVDEVNSDYHLLSSSPCVDAGDPLVSCIEPQPNANIVNLGRYGNTNEATVSSITDFPYMAEFATGPNGWTKGPLPYEWVYSNECDGDATPTANTGPACDMTENGGGFMYIPYSSGYKALLSKPLDLTLVTNPVVSFGYHMYGIHCYSLRVYVRKNGGWYYLYAINGQQQTSHNDPWREMTISLNSHKTTSTQVLFYAYANGPYGNISVDDVWIGQSGTKSNVIEPPIVKVSESELGLDISPVASVNFEVFPNPSAGLVNVSGISSGSDVKVFSLTGSLIKHYNNVNNSIEIDLSNETKGMYFIEVSNDNKKKTRKLIIN